MLMIDFEDRERASNAFAEETWRKPMASKSRVPGVEATVHDHAR
jgi:hypothetical protein